VVARGVLASAAREFELGELGTRLGSRLMPDEAEDMWTTLWHEQAHHSTAIEGNTLVMDKTRDTRP
jgi:cell filamentation protein, protein adenylyltransferase